VRDEVLTAEALASLVLAAQLNELTSYQVPPRTQTTASGPFTKAR
jgi:hypothetical protein